MRPPKYQKFPLFGKESPRRGKPFDRFLQLLGTFIGPTILHQIFTFDAIRFTGYGVIAEKPRVGHLARNFPSTLQEKLRDRSKIDLTFLMISTSSIIVKSLGKILLRAPAVVAKMWCLYLFICHARRPVRCCSRSTYFEQVLCHRLRADFHSVFIGFFFRRDFCFRTTREFPFLSPDGATIFAKLRSKLRKLQKSAKKGCAHKFVQITERF